MRRLAICFLAAIFLSGCNKEEPAAQHDAAMDSAASAKVAEKAIEKAIETQTGNDTQVHVGQGEVDIQSSDGSLSVSKAGKARIPEGFPADVPILPGAHVVMASREQQNFTISLQSDLAAEKAAQEYHTLMIADGWQRNVNHQAHTVFMMGYDKGERHINLNIFADAKSGKTQIALIVVAKKR